MQDPAFWSRPEENKAVLQRRRAAEKKVKLLRRLRKDAEELATWRELSTRTRPRSRPRCTRFTERLETELASLELELKLSGPDDEQATRSWRSTPAPAAPSRRTGPRCCCACTCAGPSATATRSSSSTGWTAKRRASRAPPSRCAARYAYGYLQRRERRAPAGADQPVRRRQARRHTSFASVYVYPEVDDDVEIEINDKDLRVDTYRSSGAGGQHVNKTDSAIRITHLPTNIVVHLPERAQPDKNRAMAMKILRVAALRPRDARSAPTEQDEREGEKMDDRLGQPDPQLRPAPLPHGQGPPHRRPRWATPTASSTATSIRSSRRSCARRWKAAQAKAAAKVPDRDDT